MSHLPLKCRKYLEDKNVQYDEVFVNNQAAIVIDPWELPCDKYDSERVSLLLLLPNGYPDAAPDMFYVNPWIRYKESSDMPNATTASFDFNGINWQRWSRHWNDWRPGIDGIQTWLIKVRHALETA